MGSDDADDRSAGLAAHRKAAREHVDVVTVFVTKPELRLVGRSLTPRHAVVRLVGAPRVVRMHQTFPGTDMRLDLPAGIAEHLLPLSRVHDGIGLQVPVPDALPRAGNRERKPFFALTQRSLCVLLLGNVSYDQLDRPIALVRLCPADTDVAHPS